MTPGQVKPKTKRPSSSTKKHNKSKKNGKAKASFKRGSKPSGKSSKIKDSRVFFPFGWNGVVANPKVYGGFQPTVVGLQFHKQLLEEGESGEKFYGAYSLTGIPVAAMPDPEKQHRGEHSYTVAAMVNTAEGPSEILVDVLLRDKACYIKKAPGGSGQISWKKHGGPGNAWAMTLEQAAIGKPAANR